MRLRFSFVLLCILGLCSVNIEAVKSFGGVCVAGQGGHNRDRGGKNRKKCKDHKKGKIEDGKIRALQKQLGDRLMGAVEYLDKLYKEACPLARRLESELDERATGWGLFCGDVEATKACVQNCAAFLGIGGIVLASYSAEDMADWLEIINKSLKDLIEDLDGEDKTSLPEMENHSDGIRSIAKELQSAFK